MFSQTRMGTSLRSGYNRIGVYFDQTLNLDFSDHQVDAGIRFYGLDYVFEHNLIGMSIGYNYNFSASKFYLGPGISAAFFRENKSSSELYVSELMFNNKIGIHAGQRFSFFSQIGIGAVFNKHSNYNIGSTTNTIYVNYEVALGVKFYWRVPTDD